MLIASTVNSQNVVVKGKFENYKGKLTGGTPGKMVPIEVSPQGTFEITIPIENADTEVGIVFIEGSPIEKVVTFRADPGSQIEFVSRKKGENRTVEFKGENADLNNYRCAFRLATAPGAVSQEEIANKAFKQYNAEVEATFNNLQKILNKVKNAQAKSKFQEMFDLTRNSVKFRYAWAIRRVKGLPVDADPDFVTFAEGINMNERRAIGESRGFDTYTGLLDQRLRWEQDRNGQKYAGDNPQNVMFSIIDKLVSDQDVKNHLLSYQMTNYYLRGGDGHLTTVFEAYKKINTDKDALDKFEKRYHELSEQMGTGKMAPDFVIIDIDGNRQKLSDLRGKVLYIDVWATWCGPCVAEIPFIEKLYEKYKDNPHLEFVSISVDDSLEAWKKKINNDKPGWKNYIVEGGFQGGPMSKLYFISAIPRFMLIDKNGQIITTNAIRPSNGGIVQELEKYMNEKPASPPAGTTGGGTTGRTTRK